MVSPVGDKIVTLRGQIRTENRPLQRESATDRPLPVGVCHTADRMPGLAPDDRHLEGGEEKMRMIVKLSGVAGVLALAACSGKTGPTDDFKKDLERASTASEISLPSTTNATQVVSAIERATPPAPRRVANSQRVAKHTPAPTRTPAPVEVEQADVSTEVEAAPVEPAPAPVQEATLPSPRPQPVATTGGDGDGSYGRGRGSAGVGIGEVIGVVLRGGIVDGDDCDPRGRRRPRAGGIVVNNIPIVGTFPGSGRLGGGSGPMLGTGRVSGGTIASIPRGGSIGRRY